MNSKVAIAARTSLQIVAFVSSSLNRTGFQWHHVAFCIVGIQIAPETEQTSSVSTEDKINDLQYRRTWKEKEIGKK